VATLQTFTSEEDAIQMANDVPYGLAATVWTTDKETARRVSEQLQTGMVWINDWLKRDLAVPFGGMKQSGVGREGGKYSLDFYSEIRNIYEAA
jgi:aminomuconate-semialdehyde/2-hydroxymuconate-6-semialdehyde dehydrogenase